MFLGGSGEASGLPNTLFVTDDHPLGGEYRLEEGQIYALYASGATTSYRLGPRVVDSEIVWAFYASGSADSNFYESRGSFPDSPSDVTSWFDVADGDTVSDFTVTSNDNTFARELEWADIVSMLDVVVVNTTSNTNYVNELAIPAATSASIGLVNAHSLSAKVVAIDALPVIAQQNLNSFSLDTSGNAVTLFQLPRINKARSLTLELFDQLS